MLLKIKVVPNSKEQKIEKISELDYKIHLKAQPVKGKANQELIELLADYFNMSKSEICIIKGKTSNKKIVEITNQNL